MSKKDIDAEENLESIKIRIYGAFDLIKQGVNIFYYRKDKELSEDRLDQAFKIVNDIIRDGNIIELSEFKEIYEDYCNKKELSKMLKINISNVFISLVITAFQKNFLEDK